MKRNEASHPAVYLIPIKKKKKNLFKVYYIFVAFYRVYCYSFHKVWMRELQL